MSQVFNPSVKYKVLCIMSHLVMLLLFICPIFIQSISFFSSNKSISLGVFEGVYMIVAIACLIFIGAVFICYRKPARIPLHNRLLPFVAIFVMAFTFFFIEEIPTISENAWYTWVKLERYKFGPIFLFQRLFCPVVQIVLVLLTIIEMFLYFRKIRLNSRISRTS